MLKGVISDVVCVVAWHIVVIEIEGEDTRMLSKVKAVIFIREVGVVQASFVLGVVVNDLIREVTIIAELVSGGSHEATSYVEECSELAYECVLSYDIPLYREFGQINLAVEFEQRAIV